MHRIPFAAPLAAAVVAIAMSVSEQVSADTVAVHHREADAHGFLTLRAMDGRMLATGEQVQTTLGNTVRKRLTFRFNDGSLDDETTEFRDAGRLRLIAYQHVQKGPSFPHPLELTIDARTGRVAVRDIGDARAAHVEEKVLALPEDLSNGLVTNIVENVKPDGLPLSVSYLAATPRPRLVRLVITSGGLDPVANAGVTRQGQHYVVDVRIGGIGGIVSTAIRKSLPRSHIWISTGIPGFLRAETPLGVDGPMWRIDLAAPGRQTD